jgi:hypothetical protein|tara:strand:+ start:42 stop:368 length:327 start_codon:yes stop_codon:yes gene_type:complete
MSTEIDYGNLTKRIIFTDNDHRQAQLLIRLKQDGLTQSAFFRHMITGYITSDERIQGYIDEVKDQSKSKKAKSSRLRNKGKATLKDFALSEGEIENIFDLLEEEHPEL